MRTVASIVAIGAAFVLPLAAAPAAHADDETVVVRGDGAGGENTPGTWLFNRDASTSTPYEFNADQASIGGGSLYVLPIGANLSDKFIGEYFAFTAVEDFESFSHDFLIAGDGTPADANEFYINVYVNLPGSDPDAFYDCRYNFIPDVGSTADFTTFEIDRDTLADSVRPRANGSAAACGSRISDADGESIIRLVAINVGDTSANDEGLAGYYDRVVFEDADGATTFDFEPSPGNRDDCKRGGFADYGFRNQGQCVSYANHNS